MSIIANLRLNTKVVVYSLHHLWLEWRHIMRIQRMAFAFDCEISKKARLTGPNQSLVIGTGTVVNAYCNLRFRTGRITIGRNVLLAQFVTILANTHRYADRSTPILQQGVDVADVTIGDDAWLGVGVVVMPGVRIGNGAIVGSNSVVTKNVGDFEVWAGSPAVKIKDRA